jgi:hypothetical protein
MTDEQFRALVNGEPIWDYHLRDPKPAKKRIKANSDEWQRLRKAKLDWCRVCNTNPFSMTLHHLVPKSLGGDDVMDNLVPLCGSGTTGCHGLIEARDEWACSLLGQRLAVKERAYVLEKKGPDFLARYYGVKEEAA